LEGIEVCKGPYLADANDESWDRLVSEAENLLSRMAQLNSGWAPINPDVGIAGLITLICVATDDFLFDLLEVASDAIAQRLELPGGERRFGVLTIAATPPTEDRQLEAKLVKMLGGTASRALRASTERMQPHAFYVLEPTASGLRVAQSPEEMAEATVQWLDVLLNSDLAELGGLLSVQNRLARGPLAVAPFEGEDAPYPLVNSVGVHCLCYPVEEMTEMATSSTWSSVREALLRGGQLVPPVPPGFPAVSRPEGHEVRGTIVPPLAKGLTPLVHIDTVLSSSDIRAGLDRRNPALEPRRKRLDRGVVARPAERWDTRTSEKQSTHR